jgi:hypothetical protein
VFQASIKLKKTDGGPKEAKTRTSTEASKSLKAAEIKEQAASRSTQITTSTGHSKGESLHGY